jgi:hypothetical protein
MYKPTPIPADSPPSLRAWLAEQVRHIADTLVAPSVTTLHLETLYIEPARPYDGDVVLADGVEWNPGSGAGVYARISGAWVKL